MKKSTRKSYSHEIAVERCHDRSSQEKLDDKKSQEHVTTIEDPTSNKVDAHTFPASDHPNTRGPEGDHPDTYKGSSYSDSKMTVKGSIYSDSRWTNSDHPKVRRGIIYSDTRTNVINPDDHKNNIHGTGINAILQSICKADNSQTIPLINSGGQHGMYMSENPKIDPPFVRNVAPMDRNTAHPTHTRRLLSEEKLQDQRNIDIITKALANKGGGAPHPKEKCDMRGVEAKVYADMEDDLPLDPPSTRTRTNSLEEYDPCTPAIKDEAYDPCEPAIKDNEEYDPCQPSIPTGDYLYLFY